VACAKLGAIAAPMNFRLPEADLRVNFDNAGVALVVTQREFAGLASGLTRFKCPARIDFVPELPRNAIGKIQKGVLRARYAPGPLAGQPGRPGTGVRQC